MALTTTDLFIVRMLGSGSNPSLEIELFAQVRVTEDAEPVGSVILLSAIWIFAMLVRQVRAIRGVSKRDPIPGPVTFMRCGGKDLLIELVRSKINALHFLIISTFDGLVLYLAGVSVATIYVCCFVLVALYVFPAYQGMAIRAGLMRDFWPIR